MSDCFYKIKVGDIVTLCFEKNANGHYSPAIRYTDYQFSFPVVSQNRYGDFEISLFKDQKDIYGFWSDPHDNFRVKYILYPEDIKIVKIKKVK